MDNLNNWKKRFIIIWTGQALSQFSSAIVQLAIIWHLTEVTGSALVLAIAGIAGFLPQGLLGPFAGVIIDRYDRKKIMILSDLGIAASTLILVITGIFTEIPIWLFMTVLAVSSIGTAFHAPTLQAVTPLIVPKDMITKCVGYAQAFRSASYIFSPAAAAVLYSMISLNNIILLDIAGALTGVLSIMMVFIPKLERKETNKKLNVFHNILAETKEGLAEIHSNGFTPLLVVLAVYFVAFIPTGTLFPVIIFTYFNKTAWHAGMVESVWAAGMLAGSFIMGFTGATKNRIYTLASASVILGLLYMCSGFLAPDRFRIFFILSIAMGLAVPFYNVHAAIFQSRIRPEYLGRVMSILNSAVVLATPAGLAIAGIAADKIGINNWFAFSGALMTVTALLFVLIPSIRNSDK